MRQTEESSTLQINIEESKKEKKKKKAPLTYRVPFCIKALYFAHVPILIVSWRYQHILCVCIIFHPGDGVHLLPPLIVSGKTEIY